MDRILPRATEQSRVTNLGLHGSIIPLRRERRNPATCQSSHHSCVRQRSHGTQTIALQASWRLHTRFSARPRQDTTIPLVLWWPIRWGCTTSTRILVPGTSRTYEAFGDSQSVRSGIQGNSKCHRRRQECRPKNGRHPSYLGSSLSFRRRRSTKCCALTRQVRARRYTAQQPTSSTPAQLPARRRRAR